jgi:hypothetical protein
LDKKLGTKKVADNSLTPVVASAVDRCALLNEVSIQRFYRNESRSIFFKRADKKLISRFQNTEVPN